ncbi:MAG: hypothetical protein QXJ46_05190 [Candidatus Bathyarchaeia archaeon]
MLVKTSLLMIELTSLPLIVLASIYLLSGYQMLAPELRIIPEPRKIHTDKFLRILTIFLMYLHASGGIIVIIERRLRKDVLRDIARTALIVVITLLLIIFLMIEATL